MNLINDPGPWQFYLQRYANSKMPILEIKRMYLTEQAQFYNQMMQFQSALEFAQGNGGGDLVLQTSSGPTPVTLAFEISSESGTNVLLSIATKIDKSVNVTLEWDEAGIVPAGSYSTAIAANTTEDLITDLGAADVNIPFRIILSDSSAIKNITWTASNDDSSPNEYQIWTAPTNFSSLENISLAGFEYQSVESLDLSNVVSDIFRWVLDALISSANLTNTNVADLAFTDCTGLTSLTLTGLTYGDEGGGYSFDFYNCILDQASVIGLLTAADASGYENGLIDVSNGTGSGNYAPNGAEELALVTSLESKGWTVRIN